MIEHTWRHDGSLQLTVRQEKRVNGEITDDWRRLVVPVEDVGRLRHLLALGPPPMSGEADGGLVAGEGLEGQQGAEDAKLLDWETIPKKPGGYDTKNNPGY